MTDFLGFLAYLLLPLIGFVVWRFEGVRKLGLGGAIPMAGAAGTLIVATIMTAMSIVGMEWSRTRLFLALVPIVAFGLVAARLRGRSETASSRDGAAIGIFILLGITAYGLLTARETCGDLLFFWGSKGIHFFAAGKIDVDYLSNPNNFYSHADYPPVLPLLFAWSNTLSRQFSWWAALLLTGLSLAGIVALIRAGTRDNRSGLLAAAVLAHTFAVANLAGAADPVLLFFEAIAVAALLFIDDPRAQTILAAIGIVGATLTKVEGASFAIAVLLALLIDRRPWKRSIAVVLPAALLLGAWLWFVKSHGLIDTYRGNGTFSFRYFAEVLENVVRIASYQAFWIPWIAPMIVIFLGDFRRARLPLTIAVLSLGATIYFYLNSQGDPTYLIVTSAPRVLLTPLLMLVFAAAVAHAPIRATTSQ